MDDLITPCYVIYSNGMRDTIEYRDDWCYAKTAQIGTTRADIKRDIRKHWDERNGIPIYNVSDHGNVTRGRAIRLRRR